MHPRGIFAAGFASVAAAAIACGTSFAADPVPIVIVVDEVPDATLVEGRAERDLFVNLPGSILDCGDVNGDGLADLAFLATVTMPSGANGESFVLLGFLFLGNPTELPFPASLCGLDPTDPRPCVFPKCQ